VLTDVRELAAVRHPTQERQARADARLLQAESPPPRIPRLRRRRRVLVSRKWSGKTIADHKNDRKNWVLACLAEAGVSATGNPTEPGRYAWKLKPPGQTEPVEQLILARLAERLEMRRQLDQAKKALDLSATGEAA
jgi:hypothetical protein